MSGWRHSSTKITLAGVITLKSRFSKQNQFNCISIGSGTVFILESEGIMAEQKYRIGIGYDIHKLVEGRDLILGGVKIPFEKGLLGHSDADVLIHAIIDALLGALAMDDIGTLFPDTDDRFKDADSLILLKNVYDKIQAQGYWISNIDSNIVAQAPKLMPYIPAMKSTLAPVLGLDEMDISIKAKTKEQLDAVGENRAISAQAIVLLEHMGDI